MEKSEKEAVVEMLNLVTVKTILEATNDVLKEHPNVDPKDLTMMQIPTRVALIYKRAGELVNDLSDDYPGDQNIFKELVKESVHFYVMKFIIEGFRNELLKAGLEYQAKTDRMNKNG